VSLAGDCDCAWVLVVFVVRADEMKCDRSRGRTLAGLLIDVRKGLCLGMLLRYSGQSRLRCHCEPK